MCGVRSRSCWVAGVACLAGRRAMISWRGLCGAFGGSRLCWLFAWVDASLLLGIGLMDPLCGCVSSQVVGILLLRAL